MALTALSQIINLPEKCPLSEIQGVMVEVYELGKFNDKNKQNFTLKDSSGVIVRATAWSHDDISLYKGKEVIIKAGPKGGLAVNNYQGKAGVSVSATCSFQTVAGGAAPQAATPANPSPSAAPAHANAAPNVRPVVNGQTIGMAIKAAIDVHNCQGQQVTKGSLWKMASMIVTVAQAMEQGKLFEEAAPAPKVAAPAPEPAPAGPDDEESPL